MMPPPAKKRCVQKKISFVAASKTLPPPGPTSCSVDADHADEITAQDSTVRSATTTTTTTSSLSTVPTTTTTTLSTVPTTVTSNKPAKKKQVTRLYHDWYMRYGFTATSDENDPTKPVPQCVVCNFTLANSGMVPNKMQRHLETHKGLEEKGMDYFVSLKAAKDKEKEGQVALLARSTIKVSDKCLLASYKVSEIMAKLKISHTMAETFLAPAMQACVEIMCGADAAKEVSKIPLSDNTIARRIEDLSADIEDVVIQNMKTAGKFALQLDESTDISGHAQLLANVRFVDGDIIRETFLFCKELPGKTTGEEVFRVTSEYFQKWNLNWADCVSVCTQHLETLEEKFATYFPSTSTTDFDWVRDPFNHDMNEDSPLHEQDELLQVRGEFGWKTKFKDLNLDSFWLSVAEQYPAIAHSAIAVLLPFSTTYLCELGFSSLTYIKSKHRERLRTIDQELRVSLSSVSPRIQTLCSRKQAQVSH